MTWNSNILNVLIEPDTHKINRFRVGQLIFICAMTFGLFCDDTVRKILFFGAIFCLTKEQITENLYRSWTGKIKIYAVTLMFFWAYMLVIPLMFGVDVFKERVISIGWPLEIVLWMWAAQLFAKDKFFVKTLSAFSIIAGTLYAVLAIRFIFSTTFIMNDHYYYSWPLHLNAWIAGSLLACSIPWVIIQMFSPFHKRWLAMLLSGIFTLLSIVMIMTLYTTFWVVLVGEIVVSILVFAVFTSNRLRIGLLRLFCAGMLVLMIGMVVACKSPVFVDTVKIQLHQILAYNTDLSVFTTQRNLVWQEAIQLITQRPWLGYGWTDYENFSKLGKGHSHSAVLQIMWTAGIIPGITVVVLCGILGSIVIADLKRNGMSFVLPFIILLILTAFLINGSLDNIFRTTRKVAMIYWIYFSLPLAAIFRDRKG